MTGATIGITLAVFVVSVLVARWFNGKLDELERLIKKATDALKEADEDRAKQRARAVTAEGRLRSALTNVERLEAEVAELRLSQERHAEALAEQVEECARLEAAVAQAERDYNGLATVLGEKTKECARQAAELAEGDRRWIRAIRSERPKHHPSGAVARALDGVVRAVRGGE